MTTPNQVHRPITDEERRYIAIAKRTLKSNGEFPTWEELAAEFGRDERVIRQADKEAFALGLVKIIGTPKHPIVCERAKRLENELKRRYHKLSSVIVADVSPVCKAVGMYGPRLDDEIHRVLGHAMANVIEEGLIFRSGDIIGVGAGRGVYYTVAALCAAPQPLFCERISVLSLTGSVEATAYIHDV